MAMLISALIVAMGCWVNYHYSYERAYHRMQKQYWSSLTNSIFKSVENSFLKDIAFIEHTILSANYLPSNHEKLFEVILLNPYFSNILMVDTSANKNLSLNQHSRIHQHSRLDLEKIIKKNQPIYIQNNIHGTFHDDLSIFYIIKLPTDQNTFLIVEKSGGFLQEILSKRKHDIVYNVSIIADGLTSKLRKSLKKESTAIASPFSFTKPKNDPLKTENESLLMENNCCFDFYYFFSLPEIKDYILHFQIEKKPSFQLNIGSFISIFYPSLIIVLLVWIAFWFLLKKDEKKWNTIKKMIGERSLWKRTAQKNMPEWMYGNDELAVAGQNLYKLYTDQSETLNNLEKLANREPKNIKVTENGNITLQNFFTTIRANHNKTIKLVREISTETNLENNIVSEKNNNLDSELIKIGKKIQTQQQYASQLKLNSAITQNLIQDLKGETFNSLQKIHEFLLDIKDKYKKESLLKNNRLNLTSMGLENPDIKNTIPDIADFLHNTYKFSYVLIYIKELSTKKFKLRGASATSPDIRLNYSELNTENPLIKAVIRKNKSIIISGENNSQSKVFSSLGLKNPDSLVLFPITFNGSCIAFIEAGSILPLSKKHIEQFQDIEKIIAVTIFAARSREEMKKIFLQSTQQYEEMHLQVDILKTKIQELEAEKPLYKHKEKLYNALVENSAHAYCKTNGSIISMNTTFAKKHQSLNEERDIFNITKVPSEKEALLEIWQKMIGEMAPGELFISHPDSNKKNILFIVPKINNNGQIEGVFIISK